MCYFTLAMVCFEQLIQAVELAFPYDGVTYCFSKKGHGPALHLNLLF